MRCSCSPAAAPAPRSCATAPSAPSSPPPSTSAAARAALKQCSRSSRSSAEDELTVRRVIASDGRSRAYLNGAVGAAAAAARGRQHPHRHPRPARIPVADAQRRAARAARRLRHDLSTLAGQVGDAHRVWLALLNRTLELEGKARDRDAQARVAALPGAGAQGAGAEARARSRPRRGARAPANRGRLAEGCADARSALLYETDEGNAHAGVAARWRASRRWRRSIRSSPR